MLEYISSNSSKNELALLNAYLIERTVLKESTVKGNNNDQNLILI